MPSINGSNTGNSDMGVGTNKRIVRVCQLKKVGPLTLLGVYT